MFQIETHAEHRHVPVSSFSFLQKREWEWTVRDRAAFLAVSNALDRTPARAGPVRSSTPSASPHAMTSVQAGEVEAVHDLTTSQRLPPAAGPVQGQTDVLTMGLPYICPYNVNSIMNPILVACLGLGYFFNLYRGRPLVREGGVVIMSHPTPWEFHPVHHPSYIDFFEQVLAETTDPLEIEAKYEESFATDPWYIHLYRTTLRLPRRPPVLHVVLVRPRHAAPRRGDHRRRRPARPCAGWASSRPRRSAMPSRWPRTSSAATRRSPTCTTRPSSWPTSPSDGRHVSVRAKALQARRRARGRGDRVAGFPWVSPTWPGSVERGPVRRSLGPDFDTEWARTPVARVARAFVLDGIIRPAVEVVASPTVTGRDRLAGVRGPVIFVANHASHLDTPLLLCSVPERFRRRMVVAGAADYFFDRHVKAVVSALALGAVPIDRTSVGRRSLHHLEDLLADDWNVIIFPEGGRTPDGWGREFTAGAAYLATKCGVPVVPVHLEGSRRVWRKGGHLRPATTAVTFGSPLPPKPGGSLSDARALAAAMEHAVAVLADEQATDWWSARRRAAAGATPPLQGPPVAAWRRAWNLGEGRRRGPGPRWPS